MLCRLLVVTLVLVSAVGSLACPDGSGQVALSGSYVLTEPSTTIDGLFGESDVGNMSIELKTDGSFYLRMPSVAYVGSWTLSGDTIELRMEMWGSTMAWIGTVRGDTISLDDGSVWKK